MRSRRATLLAALAVLVVACSGTPTTPTPAPTPTPSPSPIVVTTPDQAVGRVIAAEPRLTGIAPYDPAMIGQASWYKVAPASGGRAFVVEVRVGWGDCQAGCINEHIWRYAVAPDGVVRVVSETGDQLPDEAWPSRETAGRTGISGTVTKGPICPVEKDPPDPSCAPRPVAEAVMVVRDPSGREVKRVTTGVDGTFFANVPAGDYVVEPQQAKGLLGTPSPQNVTVRDGFTSHLRFDYDTGIR